MAGYLRIVGFPAALCATLVASAASAATIGVPADAPTIAAGLSLAAFGDTVLVDCGTWSEYGLNIPSGVTLRSITGDPACTTIDARKRGRILDIVRRTDVRIEGLTLLNGVALTGSFFENAGGAVRCDSSVVTVARCRLIANAAAVGAGLASRASTLTIDTCDFEADSATSTQWSAGGGLYARSSLGTVASCTFERNASYAQTFPGDGGGVFLDDCDLAFTDCLFSENGAGVGAAGLYSFLHDRSRILRCTFIGNVAPAGAAVYVEAAQPFFDECTFTSNIAWNGGAMLIGVYQGIRATPTIEDCNFESNVAQPYAGGALDVWNSSPVIRRCTFRTCVSGNKGGAMAAHGTSAINVSDCLLEGNVGQAGGGAVWAEGQAIGALVRCTVRGSSSGAGSGAVETSEQSAMVVNSSIVAFSVLGSAAKCGGSSTLAFSCSDAYGNAGGDWIGCLANQLGASGNFAGDPFFCTPTGDASLRYPDSPCLAANSPCGIQVGMAGPGCGCPTGATILVPEDYPTIAAALTAAGPGDVVGVCAGEWAGSFTLPSGVHLIGAGRDLTRVFPDSTAPGLAVLRVANDVDSTLVADLTLDGRGIVAQVVLAESLSTGLRLVRTTITGGASCGVVNGPDSHIQIGGEGLAFGNDLYDNGGATPRNVRNENVTADSLDATYNYWGTTSYGAVLSSLEGPVRACPIANAVHDSAECVVTDAPRVDGVPVTLLVAPNPFQGSTRISFAGRSGGPVNVRVYDVAGRRVRELRSGPLLEGRGEAWWDGRDDRTRLVAPGVYFVRLESGKASATRKIVLVR